MTRAADAMEPGIVHNYYWNNRSNDQIKALTCMVTRLTTRSQWRRYGFSSLMSWSTILDCVSVSDSHCSVIVQ